MVDFCTELLHEFMNRWLREASMKRAEEEGGDFGAGENADEIPITHSRP